MQLFLGNTAKTYVIITGIFKNISWFFTLLKNLQVLTFYDFNIFQICLFVKIYEGHKDCGETLYRPIVLLLLPALLLFFLNMFILIVQRSKEPFVTLN